MAHEVHKRIEEASAEFEAHGSPAAAVDPETGDLVAA